jgi:hypothetical protein
MRIAIRRLKKGPLQFIEGFSVESIRELDRH